MRPCCNRRAVVAATALWCRLGHGFALLSPALRLHKQASLKACWGAPTLTQALQRRCAGTIRRSSATASSTSSTDTSTALAPLVVPILDLRGVDAFAAGHLVGATHLPLAELEQRAFELPAPFGGELTLLAASANDLTKAASWLREKGWTLALLLEWPHHAQAPHVSTSVLPCNILDGGEDDGVAAAGAGASSCTSGNDSTSSSGDKSFDSSSSSSSSTATSWEIVTGSVSTPCWSPSPFLAEVLKEKLSVPAWLNQWPRSSTSIADASVGGENSSNKNSECIDDHRLVALDLGCGSGRDAVAMALALPADRFRVVGVDNHASALARARDLAKREGVADHCAFVQINLRKLPRASPLTRDQIKGKVPLPPPRPSALFDAIDAAPCAPVAESDAAVVAAAAVEAARVETTEIVASDSTICSSGVLGPCGRIALVHGHRFLDRTLLQHIRNDSEALVPGGALIWSTFMEGEENLAPPYRPSRRLFPGELKHTFEESGGFETLFNEVGMLNTRATDVPASFYAGVKPK